MYIRRTTRIHRLDDVRRFAARETLFPKTTLARALARLGFVQADPIRAPARAEDLVLRHRVRGYRDGDLARRYAKLGVEEDVFVNYGFVTRALQALMHPRPAVSVPALGGVGWPRERVKRAKLVLDFVKERGTVHPRDVEATFAHGKVQSYWGGTTNATTQLLDAMHYRGLLRVVRRDGGTRIYAAREHAPVDLDDEALRARMDTLVDAVVRLYAPLPARSLSFYIRRLRFAAPQWNGELGAAIERAKARLARATVDGVDWYWVPGDDAAARRPPDVTAREGALDASFGYFGSAPPRDRAFRRELDLELDRLRHFLGVG